MAFRDTLFCCFAKDILRKELEIVQARILDETRPCPLHNSSNFCETLHLLWVPWWRNWNATKWAPQKCTYFQSAKNQNHGQFFFLPTRVAIRRCARKELNTICGSLTGWNSSTLAVVAGGSDNLFTRGTSEASLQKRVVFWHLGWNCIYGISKAMASGSRPLCLHLAWCSYQDSSRLIKCVKRWTHGTRHWKSSISWWVAVWSWGFSAIGWSRWAYDRQPSGARHENGSDLTYFKRFAMFFQIAPLFLLSRCGWPPKRIRWARLAQCLWSCGVRLVSWDFALSGGKQADDISDSDLKSEASSATQSAAKKAAANTPNAAPRPWTFLHFHSILVTLIALAGTLPVWTCTEYAET